MSFIKKRMEVTGRQGGMFRTRHAFLSWGRQTQPMQSHPLFNLLTLNVNYSGHTAPLTSKVAFYILIQQIQVLNILNMVYTLRFFLFKMQFVS